MNPTLQTTNSAAPQKPLVTNHGTRNNNTRKGIQGIQQNAIGYKLPYHAINTLAKKAWGSHGLEQVLSMYDGFLVFCFTEESAIADIMEKGPWMFGGKNIILQKWTPSFQFDRKKIAAVFVWVRLRGLPLPLWTKQGLRLAASMIGKPLSCDEQTMQCSRLDYARLCVELNASFPFVHHFDVISPLTKEPQHVSVDYEWKPPRCESCQSCGHSCRQREEQEARATREKENESWRTVSKDPVPEAKGKGGMEQGTNLHAQGISKASATSIAVNISHHQQPLEPKEPEDIGGKGKGHVLEEDESSHYEEGEVSLGPQTEEGTSRAKNTSTNSPKQSPPRKKKGGRRRRGQRPLSIVTEVNMGSQWITCDMLARDGSGAIRVTMVYGLNTPAERRSLWNYMVQQHNDNNTLPWVVAGDFNAILNRSDRCGGDNNWPSHMDEFPNCVAQSELIQLTARGLRYTWDNGRQGEGTILKKLDWAFGTKHLLTKWPLTQTTIHPRLSSDHSPIQINFSPRAQHPKARFKFLNFWTKLEGYERAVQAAWMTETYGNPFSKLTSKLRILKGPNRNL
ncbi:hypothetical protein OIU85_016906 [Salix viminalis]|uniref:DUF4283 domain-containing protein n=1 Tax=Salix viminalis TaxID=40686 RepID=A0A9Q0ZQG4_SALVM|nr:hypothetical protein OIU85_016906 [Salix viminalis]